MRRQSNRGNSRDQEEEGEEEKREKTNKVREENNRKTRLFFLSRPGKGPVFTWLFCTVDTVHPDMTTQKIEIKKLKHSGQ